MAHNVANIPLNHTPLNGNLHGQRSRFCSNAITIISGATPGHDRAAMGLPARLKYVLALLELQMPTILLNRMLTLAARRWEADETFFCYPPGFFVSFYNFVPATISVFLTECLFYRKFQQRVAGGFFFTAPR
jgi:hypothetical protein